MPKPLPLPPTTTRCYDSRCGARDDCERWLQRENKNPATRRAWTLKPGWFTHDEPCLMRIRPQPRLDALIERGPAGWLVVGWLIGAEPARLQTALLRQESTA
jgi:hypothetical protein